MKPPKHDSILCVYTCVNSVLACRIACSVAVGGCVYYQETGGAGATRGTWVIYIYAMPDLLFVHSGKYFRSRSTVSIDYAHNVQP
jgi:hypothetical protein